MGTTLKAVVMLAVVVGGPAAYLYHGPLPPQVQRFVDRATTAARELAGRDQPAPLDGAVDCPGGVCPVEAPAISTASTPHLPAALASDFPVTPSRASTPQPDATTAVDAGSLQPLLDHLVQMDVGEYELSRWGSAGNLYRFRCAAALAGDLQHARHFEAVGVSPTESIEKVVAEVAAWRLARNDSSFIR